MIKPLTVSALDLESTTRPIQKNKNLACHESVPTAATFSQDVLAYSFAHKSLYSRHKLPLNLADARILIFDDQKFSQTEFYHKLFSTLRTDVALLHDFLIECLAQDEGTPAFAQLNNFERLQYFLTKRCQLCHRRFQSKVKSVTGRVYRVTRVIDHSHLAESFVPQFGNQLGTHFDKNNPLTSRSRVRFICCQGCNLQLSLATVNSRIRQTIWVHNGKWHNNKEMIAQN